MWNRVMSVVAGWWRRLTYACHPFPEHAWVQAGTARTCGRCGHTQHYGVHGYDPGDGHPHGPSWG